MNNYNSGIHFYIGVGWWRETKDYKDVIHESFRSDIAYAVFDSNNTNRWYKRQEKDYINYLTGR